MQIFSILLKDKELGTPRNQGITPRQPDSQGSDSDVLLEIHFLPLLLLNLLHLQEEQE